MKRRRSIVVAYVWIEIVEVLKEIEGDDARFFEASDVQRGEPVSCCLAEVGKVIIFQQVKSLIVAKIDR